jgi:transposase
MADKQDTIKMIELYQSGSTLKEVGAKFGVHRKMVSKILKDNGVQIIRRRNNFITKEKLYDLYVNQELPSRQIANQVGFKDHKSVTLWLKKYNIPIRHKNYFTEKRRKLVSEKLKVSSILVTNNPMKKPEIIEKMKKTIREKGPLYMRGENNPAWKGGVTDANRLARGSIENDEFRRIVFARDNYTCQLCGDDKKRIEANHIKLFSENKELRFEPSNGITLCKDCHQSIRGKEHELESVFISIISSKHISKKQIQKIKDEILSKIYLYRDKEWLLNNYVNKKRKISTIARECNVDQGTINTWIHKFKIPLNKVDESQVLQAYKDGLSVEKIQVKFNLAPKSVYDILNKYDVPLRHIQIEKERQEKIKLLKIDYENGMSKRELKKKYNMGGGTIVKILGYDKK